VVFVEVVTKVTFFRRLSGLSARVATTLGRVPAPMERVAVLRSEGDGVRGKGDDWVDWALLVPAVLGHSEQFPCAAPQGRFARLYHFSWTSQSAKEMPLKFLGATTRQGGKVSLGHLTVLVGANNSGKSQTLRDLRDYATTGTGESLKLFQNVEATLPSEPEMQAHLTRRMRLDNPGEEIVTCITANLFEVHTVQAQRGWLDKVLARDFGDLPFFQNFGRCLISHLHAETRFTLTAPQECFDLETEEPRNALQQFFRVRQTVQPALRAAFNEAFGRDIALDYSAMKRWYFKVDHAFGDLSDSLEALRTQLASGEQLTLQGDGYRSFVGIALAALTFPDRVLLLDEPEAFLHPSQVRILGRWLAELSQQRAAQVIVATHSADFLWGIVSANPDAMVLRLQRDGDRTHFVQVPSATTAGLAQSPLLSSQPVLDALFHKGVVVCEGDPDRALYQAVAHKTLSDERGEDILFIHTNGKDAADVPIELFRSAGAPVCAVVDIDIISANEPLAKIVKALTGQEISAQLEARRAEVAGWVEAVSADQFLQGLLEAVSAWLRGPHQNVREARRRLTGMAKSATSKWDRVKKKGICCFEGEQRLRVESLLRELASIGLFVVPCGELEGWLENGAAKGKAWNRTALESIQADDCPVELKLFLSAILRYLAPRGAGENTSDELFLSLFKCERWATSGKQLGSFESPA
jgi:predicted ATPase